MLWAAAAARAGFPKAFEHRPHRHFMDGSRVMPALLHLVIVDGRRGTVRRPRSRSWRRERQTLSKDLLQDSLNCVQFAGEQLEPLAKDGHERGHHGRWVPGPK